jgi:aminoglycoside 6'-N-acetyltransferase
MRLRPAPLADIDLLRRWNRAPHIIEAKGTEDWQWERELALEEEWQEQLIAEMDGRPIGFIQIIDPAREKSHYWGECPANLRAVDIWN